MKKKQLLIKLDADLHKHFKKACEETEVTMNRVVARAIFNFITQHFKQKHLRKDDDKSKSNHRREDRNS